MQLLSLNVYKLIDICDWNTQEGRRSTKLRNQGLSMTAVKD